MAVRRFRTNEDEKGPAAPVMRRSKNQLATAYAPGAFFTFEGGQGACISLPDNSSAPDTAVLTDSTKNQILMRLQEIWQSWYERAKSVSTPERPVAPSQCLEEALVPNGVLTPLSEDRITFANPLKMTYAPAPLTFVCNRCQAFRRYDTVKEAMHGPGSLANAKCSASFEGKELCRWRQLDVIFVHWSGEWLPARPGRFEWNAAIGRATIGPESCRLCGCEEFRLDTSSPRIGSWRFYCARNPQHVADAEWLQHDEFTTRILKDQGGGARLAERRMEAISYRASAAFYAHSEQFILFSSEDQELLALLEPARREALASFIARNYRYGGPELTPAEMREKLLAAGHASDWASYENFEKVIDGMKMSGMTEALPLMQQELAKLVTAWKESGKLPPSGELPPAVKDQLFLRSDIYPIRYDPFVLAVEHEALSRSKLRTHEVAGRSAYVRFKHMDRDLAPKDQAAKDRQEAQTGVLMDRLGLADLGLIREFDLCRFTHGYTRVSASPTVEKHKHELPVRLRLFEPLGNKRRPIYVVTQGNEAIYARLNPAAVYRWLEAVGVVDLPAWDPAEPVLLGGRILETAHSFGPFFSLLKAGDASTYRYVYTLLHTYAHSLMKNIAELSGLDLGSLGEYVFPTDLAFVVYRNGTTMDLGNLSALWRNEENRFLARLLEPDAHRCNSGSLCDAGGGACPDCVMIPETSCLAQNRLLSRAILSGGPAPREDQTHAGRRITGYLETLNAAQP